VPGWLTLSFAGLPNFTEISTVLKDSLTSLTESPVAFSGFPMDRSMTAISLLAVAS